MKTCPRCFKDLPLSEFHKDSLRKDGLAFKCKQCVRHYAIANKDAIIAKTTEWQKNNPEKVKSYIANYRAKQRQLNPPKVRITLTPEQKAIKKKETALRDKEKRNNYNSLYREKNREKLNAKKREYYKNNSDKRISGNHRRRANKLNNRFEFYTQEQVIQAYGAICYICNIKIDMTAPRRPGRIGWELGLQIDHVIPISKNGPDNLENVRPTHAKCNLKKSDTMI